MKKAWSLLALAAIGSVVFANVDLRTNIQDIYYRGTCEEAGAITMSVNGNDFFEASTATPVFIRVRLDKGGLLCNTLVDYQGRPDDDPIYLAMRLEGAAIIFTTFINAPPETVSIVRWKGGEPELWLRVQFTSNQWLYNPSWTATNFMAPPNHDARVAWTFGNTARNSWRDNAPRYPATANLPYNTFDVQNTLLAFGTAAETGWAASTLLCVDVSQSILTPMPELNSELNFDTISYAGDVDEEGNDTGFQTTGVMTCSTWSCIRTGDQTPANFSGDDTIARGFDITCSWGIKKHPLVSKPLCLTEVYQGTDQGLICLTNSVDIDIRCDYGLNYNTNIQLITPGAGYYGFLVDVDSNGNPYVYYDDLWLVEGVVITNDDNLWTAGDWDVVTPAEYTYVEGGYLFTPIAIAIYGGDDIAGPRVQGEVKATVCTWYDNEPSDVVILMAAALTNHGSQFDADQDNLFIGLWDDGDPFEGVTAYDQRKYCPQSYLWLNDIEWDFGAFTDCCSGRVSIFYPYMPKLIGTDWYVGFGVVNQGLVSFGAGEVQARVWEADGNLWTFDLPPLPQRASQTYLMIDGDQGIGLYDDDGNFIAPATTGSDLVMGDVRSSMFVTAFHCGVSWGDIYGPDLDGFALIGNSVTLESFGYLPRNTVPGIDQTGDMPIMMTKKPNYDFMNVRELQTALPRNRKLR